MSRASRWLAVVGMLLVLGDALAVDETMLVISLLRYGNTTPESGINITKYGDEPAKFLYSERLVLTEVGKRQMFLMGKYYKQKYPELLGDNLKNNDITAISSDNSRTVMAAHAFLLGLTKDTEELKTKTEDVRLMPKFKSIKQETKLQTPTFDTPLPTGWNTITIQATSAQNDTLLNLNSKEVCPNRNLVLSRREKKRLEQYLNATEAMKKVAEIYGIDQKRINFTDLIYCYSLFSLVESDYYRRSKPIISKEGQYSDVFYTMSNCSAASMIGTYGSDDDLITDASNLFINISSTIQSYIERDANRSIDIKQKAKRRKFILYSSHKKSFFPAMVILGMSSRKCIENDYRGLPPPENQNCFEFPHSASHISFELIRRKDPDTAKNSYWVKVYFKDQPVTLPNESSPTIPAAAFLSFVNRSINLEWEAHCGLFPPTKLQVHSQKWIVLLIISNAALFTIIAVIFWYMWRHKSPRVDVSPDDSGNYSIISDKK